VRIALVDQTGKPRIRLGIQGEDPEKRYTLGTVRIAPTRSEAGCDSARCP
jgi:hypothetical protein